LAQRRGTPLLFTYHTRWTEYAHYMPWNQRLTKAQAVWVSREYCNRCSEVIAPTHEMAAVLREYGVERPIHVVPTGVDMDAFRGGVPDAAVLRASAGGPIVLYAGRIGKEKNIDLLLDAFALAAARVPTARFFLAGCGPYESRLRERIAGLPCSDRIIFTGALEKPELGSYYRASDVFAFASTTETQGLVLIEAMAHGVPVAAVDCPVSREVVGSAAGVLTGRDAHALADGIVALALAGDEERRRRRQAAIDAAKPYSIDALVAELEAAYERAASAQGGSAVFG
jgi:glycosyltransferase involved in cell wall biosynthesis